MNKLHKRKMKTLRRDKNKSAKRKVNKNWKEPSNGINDLVHCYEGRTIVFFKIPKPFIPLSSHCWSMKMIMFQWIVVCVDPKWNLPTTLITPFHLHPFVTQRRPWRKDYLTEVALIVNRRSWSHGFQNQRSIQDFVKLITRRWHKKKCKTKIMTTWLP